MSDNFKVDIAWKGDMRKAMEIAFSNHSRAEAYTVDPKKGMIFFWHAAGGTIALPFKMDAEAAADFASRWLSEQGSGCTEADLSAD